jgi:hypothetical protein
MLGGLLVVGCGTPTAPERAVARCPYIVRTRDTVYVVRGVPVRVIDTTRRCL